MYLKTKLDAFLNSITMYRTIVLSLVALFVCALVFSFGGVLVFRPGDILLCAALFVGVAYGTSRLFAYLFDVQAHHESALVTGGILFFLFAPVLTPANVILYSLIAVIAMASKYLLVWRGRHVFNPAAIAAVIIALTGLQSASWWVAATPLAIPTLLLACLILYKTRRFALAGTFMAVALAVAAASATMAGHAITDTLLVVTTSWPLLFFVGFMLPEPLTLPPRRYQYLIEAVIVAVLAAGGLTVAGIGITPEIALVIGNLVAFAFARRTGIVLKLAKRTMLPGSQMQLDFTLKRSLNYLPGQYLELTLPHAHADGRGKRRLFTIASAPGAKTVKIVTRLAIPSSSFKTALQSLSVGQSIAATAVRGDFLLPSDPAQKLLFIAGGIGITPFRAQLEWLVQADQKRDGILIYAVRHSSEVLFSDVLLAKKHGIHLVVVADDDGKAVPEGAAFVRAPYVDAEVIQQAAPDIARRYVYISGPPPMVANVRRAARTLEAGGMRVDEFTGY